MSKGSLLTGVGVAVLSVFSTTGCSFWGFGGGGPVDKDTAYRLYGHAPLKLGQSGYRSVYDNSFQAVPWSTLTQESAGVAAGGATFRQSSGTSLGGLFVLGYTEGQSRILLDRGADKTERLIDSWGAFFPLFPLSALWLSTWDTWYSLDQGEEIAQRSSDGLGPLGVIAGYTQCVQPADILQADGTLLVCSPGTFGRQLAGVAATRGLDARYNSQWGWHILGGAIGWGRVNYQYFVQVAWVPIPLWRVRE